MIAGLVGVLAGGLALYFAPAQSIRYNALATSTSLLGRVSARSMMANVRIVIGPYAALWKLGLWLVPVAIGWRVRAKLARPDVVSIAVALAASLLISLTLLVSPKQGGRLDFASICLACMAVASFVMPFVRSRLAQLVAWLFAAAAVAYLLFNLLVTYGRVGPEFQARFDAIESAPPHARVQVAPYTLRRSRWFLGEDFASDPLRFGIAWNRKLDGVELTAPAEANEDPGGL